MIAVVFGNWNVTVFSGKSTFVNCSLILLNVKYLIMLLGKRLKNKP